jgi:hypothetical protein
MATEREIRSLIAPVLDRYPSWKHKNWMFCTPVGYYYRGVAFSRSWSNRNSVSIWRCVFPLYESGGPNANWGQIYSIPGVVNCSWDMRDPRFAENLIEVMENEIIPSTAHIQTGGDFLHYLQHNVTRGGWPNWGKALAHIHMGELDTAGELLLSCASSIKKIDKLAPFSRDADSWAMNLLELLRLIEEDRNAIPAHCEAVARKTVAACKLEKFWEPTPFVYDARRSMT